ncbi:MAG TPA: ATP-binding protein [Kofleriaceae bacterium]|nr:ATP-binding protein [Kofleriaceae bacterium]
MPTEPELLRLFDRSPIGMYRSDARGHLLVVNPALVSMLGYDSVEEVLALDLRKDVYVNAAERAPVLEQYRESGFVEGTRVHWKTRTGRILTVQIFGHVVETKDGLVFDATVIDLTEIDVLEAELHRQREVVDQVMRQMPAVYWITDTAMRIVRTGGGIEQMLGFPANKFVGKTLQEALAVHPSNVDTVNAHERALAGEITIRESQYRGKMLASTIAPYRNTAGEIIGVVGTSIDVTTWRMLERRMVDAQRAESLGVLAGGLAHDFNNLLVAVLGNADLALRDIPVGQQGRTAIENIRIAGLRAAELTDQLLAYAGRGGAGTTRVEIAAIIEELLRIVGSQVPPELNINVDISSKHAVRGDPAQLRQVLLNLINNAREAMPARGGDITILAEAMHSTGDVDPDDILSAPAGSYVAIRVVDTGPGMDSDTRRHVFEPFFTTKQTGHGLGLAAVLGIVRAHGGGIRVRSRPGAGTEIAVLWPAAVTAPMRATPAPTSGRTVLVIDDEALVRDVVARMIEDLGYAAVTAVDGPTGLDLVERSAVDAVLVDLSMPQMSGADVVAALRRKKPGLPVVVCSGYDRDGRGPVQADAYLPKPFRIDALERTLAKLLPLRSV